MAATLPIITASNIRQHQPRVSLSQKAGNIFRNHLGFIGPGLVAAVAYCDPGNWATDLEAGSTYGYAHLFIILSASIMAIVLQVLATRLGYITGKDLAQHCREKFYDRPKHKMLWRWACLYPLYVLCEGGIIFTDLAELLGSAIALHMLFPKLPLFAGVLLTSTDVFLVLAFFNSYPDVSNKNRRSMKLFEFSVSILVICVLVSFIILLVKVKPVWGETFEGFLPSRGMIANGGLYLAVSVIGATVMPHSIFLGSKVAILDRLCKSPKKDKESQLPHASKLIATDHSTPIQLHGALSSIPQAQGNCLREVESHPIAVSVEHLNKHLAHASFDIALSLLTFALPINAAILIVASAAFHYGGADGPIQVADLASAHELLMSRVGVVSGYVFAIALLVSGQAASITCTLAGQIVSEGFLEWRTQPVVRRLVTRLIGIVPSAAVAGAVGVRGVDSLLVGSQVALSLVLPFVLAPLIILTSDTKIMSVQIYEPDLISSTHDGVVDCPTILKDSGSQQNVPVNEAKKEEILASKLTSHSFENHIVTQVATWFIFVICSGSNIYGIIQLAQGRT